MKIVRNVIASVMLILCASAFYAEEAQETPGQDENAQSTAEKRPPSLFLYGRLTGGFTSRTFLSNDQNNIDFEFVGEQPISNDTLFGGGDYAYKAFEILPVIGLGTMIYKDNVSRSIGVGIEVSLGGVFGSGKKIDVKSIEPGARVLVSKFYDDFPYKFMRKIVPYAGLGFSVPITMVSAEYDYEIKGIASWRYSNKTVTCKGDGVIANFVWNAFAGAKYEITDNLSAVIEGTVFWMNITGFTLRAGAEYKFKRY